MSRQKVEVDITANTTGLKKGMGEGAQAASSLEKALSKLGPVGKVIQGGIDKIGLSSVSSAAGIGIAAAAVGTAIAFGEKAIDMYVSLGEKIRNYSKISGQSAEDSSRQVQAFEALGVSSDTAAAAMFRLGREAGAGGAKLKAVGVEIATNDKGTVDLNATLINVIKAYHATGDAAEKDRIIFAAFGKGGAAMVPILEANVDELTKLQASIDRVYTAKDLEAIRQYKISQKELKRSTDELGLSIGQALLPPLKGLVDSSNEAFYIQKRLKEAQEQGTITGQNQAKQIENLTAKYADEWKQAQIDQQKTDDLADAQRNAAEMAKRDAEAEDALYNALHKSTDAGFAYEQALIDLEKAKQADKDAGGKDAQANLNLREAYVHVADAAVAVAEQQAAVNGTTITAADKATIYRNTLQDQANTLAPGSPLRKNLQDYIDALNRIPASKTTTVAVRGVSTTPGAHGNVSYDEGGVVPGPPGSVQTVQARAGEEFMGYGSGRRSGGNTIHIHIESGAFIDGHGIDMLANLILQRVRFAPGT